MSFKAGLCTLPAAMAFTTVLLFSYWPPVSLSVPGLFGNRARGQVMQAIRLSTFGDMKSSVTLLEVRGAILRTPVHRVNDLHDKRFLDSFSEAGYFFAAASMRSRSSGFGMYARTGAPTCDRAESMPNPRS